MSTCRVTIANYPHTPSPTPPPMQTASYVISKPSYLHPTPIIFMSAMVTSLNFNNLNNLRQLTSKGDPIKNKSLQNKVNRDGLDRHNRLPGWRFYPLPLCGLMRPLLRTVHSSQIHNQARGSARTGSGQKMTHGLNVLVSILGSNLLARFIHKRVKIIHFSYKHKVRKIIRHERL
jgi:hypothetical protein